MAIEPNASILYVRNIDGTLSPVEASNGKPRMSCTPYLYDIAEGQITDHAPWAKMGWNGDIDNAEEDLIAQGGVYTFPTVAIKMDIVSSSVNDDGNPVGTGARTVTIYGLDSTYAEISETITMNGTTLVQTVNTYFRINHMRVTTAGSVGKADGNISLSETGGTSYKYGYIQAGQTRQRQMIYTVPLGKTLYISSLTMSGANAAVSHWAKFTMRANFDDKALAVLPVGLFNAYGEYLLVDHSFTKEFELPLRVPATVDLKLSAISDGASANEICSSMARGWLENA